MTTDKCTDGEVFRPIPGWEGHYEISSKGVVRSVARTIVCKNGARKNLRGHILTQTTNGRGYLKVTLAKNGVHTQRYVHQLVLETFVGPRPEGLEACHADDNRSNNTVENLRWDTHSANNFDRVANGGHPLAAKTHCKHGHRFTPDNIYWTDNGRHRHCKKCTLARNAKYAAARRARKKAI
ncbi:NUMOD4 motif-containing HNH endonuclease [uncultured Corynebacterium sp.]|uniref:NUMOD4 motif-containing HNH endonuclease n=1 Tax=uncultured Corynebacterium sp. TaxID=159447 RepID=UPI0033903C48